MCKLLIDKFNAKMKVKLIERGNLKKFFKYVNRKLNSSNPVAPLTDVSGNTVSDDKIKAELLSSFSLSHPKLLYTCESFWYKRADS